MDEKGKVLRSVEKLKRGTLLRTRLADGELESQVLRVSSADSAGQRQIDAPSQLLPRLRRGVKATSQAPHKLGPAGKPTAAATGVADGDPRRQAAKGQLCCTQITRQKKNGPANWQARPKL